MNGSIEKVRVGKMDGNCRIKSENELQVIQRAGKGTVLFIFLEKLLVKAGNNDKSVS